MIYLAFIHVRFNVPVHVYFDKEERPFLLDADMRWAVEPNAFLVYVSVIKGKTGSPRTWRSYAYQFADWLAFCEKIGVEWRHATLLTIATYVLCRLKMEPLPQNCRKHCAKLCEFCVDPIASSSREAVSYTRLTEAGFDSSRLGLGASLTPHGSRNHWFLRMLGEVDSAVARRLERS